MHLHVRDDEEQATDPQRFARCAEGIRKHCPARVTLSTGGRSGTGRERGGMLSLKPDMASLATGSVNFPARVYENSPELVEWLAAEMIKHKVKPEVEAFDLSMIYQAAAMQKAGKIKGSLHVQFVMGVKNAMPVDRPFRVFVSTLKGSIRMQHGLAPASARTRSRCRAGRRAWRTLPDRPRGQRAHEPRRARAVECGAGTRRPRSFSRSTRRPATAAEARKILAL